VARYTGPVCRLCRREGAKLYLKGTRCYTPKCSVEKRNYAPGQHGQARQRSKTSQYGIQLREKQKLRRIYGLQEAQFQSYFRLAARQKGVTGENFLRLLERRLDNVVFRLGMASSRNQARHLVGHGHFLVNDRRVDVPSMLVKPGDVITLKERSQDVPQVRENLELNKTRQVPAWLELDGANFTGRMLALPGREEIDTQVREQLVVEFYSK